LIINEVLCMEAILLILHVFVCVVLILTVLLQTGKGADMGAVFGGGGSSSLFGSAGPGSFLTKLTTFSAIVFMLTSISLAYMSSHQPGTGDFMEKGALAKGKKAQTAATKTTPAVPAKKAEQQPPVQAEAKKELPAPAPVAPAAKAEAPAPVPTPAPVAPAANAVPAPVPAPAPVTPAANAVPAPVPTPAPVAPAANAVPAPVPAPAPVTPAPVMPLPEEKKDPAAQKVEGQAVPAPTNPAPVEPIK
jgi:preprotein translocase subunit SecG